MTTPPKPEELKELANFCWELSVSYALDFKGNERDKLRRIHELLAKLAEEELSK